MADPSRHAPAPLVSLQVLRAVAALLVLVHHAGHDADAIAARTGVPALRLDRAFDFGFGIHLFFVISGFIMLRTARGYGSARGAATFMARRLVRVVPLYWLMTSCVLLGAAVAPGLLNAPPGGAAVVLGSYAFVPVPRVDGTIQPVLGQGWTLDYEMFFYGLFALAMLLPRRAALAGLAAALVGLVVTGRLVEPPIAALAVWTDGLLLEFLFGLALGLAAERGVAVGAAGAVAAVVLGAAAAVALGPATGRFGSVPAWMAGGLPAALVVGGCVLGPRWRAAPALWIPLLVGDASYSLYLSHPFAVRLLRNAWLAAAPSATAPWLYLAVACLAAILGGLALHRWVERPMTDRLQGSLPAGRSAGRPILPEVAEAARRR